MKRYLITAVILLVIDSASAQISDHERQALNNPQHEMTTCAVFYAMMRQCIINRGRPKEDGKLIQDADGAIDRLLKDATSLGLSLGMTKDAMSSRMVNDRATMRELINNDCINTSSLLRRYAARCKQVVENPDSILTEHMTPR